MEEEPDAAALFASQQREIDRPEEATLDPDLEFYMRAWSELQHDRHVGDMGGVGGIYYAAISQYAKDRHVTEDQFEIFHALIRALDAEYQIWVREVREAEEEARKSREGRH